MDEIPPNLLTATAADLSRLLAEKKITAVELVELYLQQITLHNHQGMKLHAVISTAPRPALIEYAKQLDEELGAGKFRSPLHGIPIIVKDVFLTGTLGMPTTCGALPWSDAKSTKNADVIEKLLEAGVIILGKGNLSELGNFKGHKIPAGWSAAGGQTQSPYVRGGIQPGALPLGHDTPAGSSSGPAVAVAAGFSPISLGTETDGSTVQPGTRAGLFALKGTLGSISTTGVQPITPSMDSIGGMAKSAEDLANLMGVLQGKAYRASLTKSWKGLRLGFVDPSRWQPADFIAEPRKDFREQFDKAYYAAISRIKEEADKVVTDVPLMTLAEIFEGGVEGITDTYDFMERDFRDALQSFLAYASYTETEVKDLAQLIKYNEEHADRALPPESPDQKVLIAALNNNMTDSTYTEGLKTIRSRSTQNILKLLSDYDIDAILGPSDGRIASVAASAGYPVGSLPLGFAGFNGRPFGMNIISAAGQEAKMLQVMSAWEVTFPEGRQPPPILVNWKSDPEWK